MGKWLEDGTGVPLAALEKAFLAGARNILRSLENAERSMAEWRGSEPMGTVAIAGDGLWHHYLLPPLLAELVRRFPRLRPGLHAMLPEDVELRVAAGEVDVGLLLRPPRRTDLEWQDAMTSRTPWQRVRAYLSRSPRSQRCLGEPFSWSWRMSRCHWPPPMEPAEREGWEMLS